MQTSLPQMLQIRLSRLRFYAFHGVLPQERTVGGDYEVSLLLTLRNAEAALLHDELEGTVNYAEVFELVRQEMGIAACLLEHLAHRIATRLLAKFDKIEEVEVSITKVNPPMGADCAGAEVVLQEKRH